MMKSLNLNVYVRQNTNYTNLKTQKTYKKCCINFVKGYNMQNFN